VIVDPARTRELLDRFAAFAEEAIAAEDDNDAVLRRCLVRFGAVETLSLLAAVAPDAAIRRVAARALGEVWRVQERWTSEAMMAALRAAGIDRDAFDPEDLAAPARAVAVIVGP
jgi:hypothetical protein